MIYYKKYPIPIEKVAYQGQVMENQPYCYLRYSELFNQERIDCICF